MKGIIMMSNDLLLYQPMQIQPLPRTTNIEEILECNLILSSSDKNKVTTALNNNLYDMAAEFIWNRTIALLRKYVIEFGSEFIAEMLDRDSTMVESVSNHEIILLTYNLGFLNKAAYIEFTQFDEIFNFYWTNEDEKELEIPYTKAFDMIRACIEHVLRFPKTTSNFSSFRDKLKLDRINADDQLIKELLTSPYFYKKTIIKTLLNLSKTVTKGAEQEIVLANLIIVIAALWNDISSEEKFTIGRSYAQAAADGSKNLIKAMKSLLMQVQGFDYVPENLRSNSYIEVAKKLYTAHYSMDNFYNEPIHAEELSKMGSSIPSPAVGACLNSVVICKLGNCYGVSWAAQSFLDEILLGITDDRWKYFLSNVLPYNDELLLLIISDSDRNNRWNSIVSTYDLDKVELTNPDSKYLLNPSIYKNFSKVKKRIQEMIHKNNKEL